MTHDLRISCVSLAFLFSLDLLTFMLYNNYTLIIHKCQGRNRMDSNERWTLCSRCCIFFALPAMSNAQAWPLCTECENHICGICQQSVLDDRWHGRYYKVICTSCLTKWHLEYEWSRSETAKISTHEGRSKAHGCEGVLYFREWLTTLTYFNWLCAYCQQQPYEQLDHFIPVSKGGGTIAANCVPACKICNKLKGQRHPDKVQSISRIDLERVRLYLSNIA